MRLVSVVIGAKNSQTRFNECSSLFNYGFAKKKKKNLLSQNEVAKEIAINKGKVSTASVYASEDFSVVGKKGEDGEYSVDYNLPSQINAPIKSGDVVGKAIVSKNGEVIKEVDLVMREDVQKLSFKDCLDHITQKW